MRKVITLLIAMVMILSMAIPAFADTTKPTITAPNNGHTYEVYQIFVGDESEGILSNVKWGANGTGTKGTAVEKAVLDALTDVSDKSDIEQLAVIKNYATLSNPIDTLNKDKLSVSVDSGYYLIMDKEDSVPAGESYTTYIVQVVDSFTINPKGDVPEIIKTVDDAEVNEAGIGEDVKYVLTGTMPTNIAEYATYYYQFNDTMSKGLTYNKDLEVTIGNVKVTDYFHVGVSEYSATNGTTIKVTIADVVALGKLEGITIDKDTKIVVTYTAKVNENAVIGNAGNPNDVKLVFSNDPNNSGTPGTTPTKPTAEPEPANPTGETPEVKVVTYVTELSIKKVDENGNVLPGVEFELTGENIKKVLVSTGFTFVANEKGEYYKLTTGEYTKDEPITENKAEEDAEGAYVEAESEFVGTVVKAGEKKYRAYDETKDAGKTRFTITEPNVNLYDLTTKYEKKYTTELKGEGQSNTQIKGEVAADGSLIFTGLGAGEYTITETKTPAGYNTIDPITFKVTFDPEEGTFDAEDPISLDGDNTLSTTIVNQKGATLPETGGIGTTIFYICGSVLLIGAAILLVTKKRMSVEE